MGKLFVRLGIWMQNVWCKFQCKWNWLISKLIFEVDQCPVSQCVCKPSSSQGIPEVNMPDPVNMGGSVEEDEYYKNSKELNK
jgi:hypothetical protein